MPRNVSQQSTYAVPSILTTCQLQRHCHLHYVLLEDPSQPCPWSFSYAVLLNQPWSYEPLDGEALQQRCRRRQESGKHPC